jgi:hypothetical protein
VESWRAERAQNRNAAPAATVQPEEREEG